MDLKDGENKNLRNKKIYMAWFLIRPCISYNGALAQPGERVVRNHEARGSSPLCSTKKI